MRPRLSTARRSRRGRTHVEAAENVSPGAVATQRRGRAARTIAQAAHRADFDFSAGGAVRGRGGGDSGRAPNTVGFAGRTAGDADINNRPDGRCRAVRKSLLARGNHGSPTLELAAAGRGDASGRSNRTAPSTKGKRRRSSSRNWRGRY